jgi:hypothetical protein
LVELDGTTPLQLGVTKWRTLVTYVPQTRVHPKGTPSEFYFTVQVGRTLKTCCTDARQTTIIPPSSLARLSEIDRYGNEQKPVINDFAGTLLA